MISFTKRGETPRWWPKRILRTDWIGAATYIQPPNVYFNAPAELVLLALQERINPAVTSRVIDLLVKRSLDKSTFLLLDNNASYELANALIKEGQFADLKKLLRANGDQEGKANLFKSVIHHYLGKDPAVSEQLRPLLLTISAVADLDKISVNNRQEEQVSLRTFFEQEEAYQKQRRLEESFKPEEQARERSARAALKRLMDEREKYDKSRWGK